MEINISLLLIKSRPEYVASSMLHYPSPFHHERLISQLQGVLPKTTLCDSPLGIVLAEENCVTQGYTSQVACIQ